MYSELYTIHVHLTICIELYIVLDKQNEVYRVSYNYRMTRDYYI